MIRGWINYFTKVFAPPAPNGKRDYLEWALEYKHPTYPTCRKDYLVSGPTGGMSINFACPTCYSRFNTGFLDEKTLFGFSETGTVTPEIFKEFFKGEKLE